VTVEDYLASVDVLDCTGAATHTLTLQVDGTVRITTPHGVPVVVDPAHRVVLTRGMEVPSTLMDAAVSLASFG
jgi:hypothetical protein